MTKDSCDTIWIRYKPMSVLYIEKLQIVWWARRKEAQYQMGDSEGHSQKRVKGAEDDSCLLLVRDRFLQTLPVTLL